jgi:predicted DCC family thiol-disulfide oxidoreductase YuxK
MEKVILFDGVCNLCNGIVQFVMKRDKKKQIKFASLQSDIGQKMVLKHYGTTTIDSFIFVDNGKAYMKSSAGLRVCKHLSGPWKLLIIFIIIPTPIRDFFYSIIAKNRYKWFGKSETCMMPTKDMKDRFLH